MADDIAQSPDDFEAALQELLGVIGEDAAAPAQAKAIERAGAAPRPRRAWVPEVGAGGYNMPYMPPLVAPNRLSGEMRSGNEFALSDVVAERTGSPMAGIVVDKIAKLGRATGQAVAGVPLWAAETGAQLGESAARDGVLPPIPSLASEAVAGEGDGSDKLRQLLETQAVLQRQAEEAKARRESFRPKGRAPTVQADPQYTAADQEFRQLNDRLAAHAKMAEQEQLVQSPAYQLQLKKENEAAEEAKRLREANTPWRVKNQALANALPNYALAASAALPGAIGVARNLRSFFPSSPQGMMRSAIAENALARSGGDAARAALTESELAHLLARTPTWKNELGEGAAAAASGGALAAEASMFPDQWDAFNLPEGPARERAKADARNPMNYLERGLMGTFTGLSGYEAGTRLTPRRDANVSRAKAIVDNPSPRSAPAPSAAAAEAPSLPSGIRLDKNGLPYDAHTGQKVRKRFFEDRGD